tara:strand:- start:5652 stop:6044 length:393 start_codon:yes stop_codon:yes gene_type:complete
MSKLIDQYLKSPSKEAVGSTTHESNNSTGSQTLDRPVMMLDLVLADRTRMAFPYTTLSRVLMDPDRGIVLSFMADEVLIEGTALESLYKAIIQHRCNRIETSSNERSLNMPIEGTPVVTGIRILGTGQDE